MAKKTAVHYLTEPSSYRAKEFEAQADLPSLWQDTARDYGYAGNKMLEWFQLVHVEWQIPESTRLTELDRYYTSINPIMMLYGLAHENIIKAVIIAKRLKPATVNGRFNPELVTHDLKHLFRFADIELESGDLRLLARLQRAVEIKYPVVTRPTTPDNYSGNWKLQEDIPGIWRLLRKLEDEIFKARPAESSASVDWSKLGRKSSMLLG